MTAITDDATITAISSKTASETPCFIRLVNLIILSRLSFIFAPDDDVVKCFAKTLPFLRVVS